MKMFVEIPTPGGAVAIDIHSIDKIERMGAMTCVKLYGKDAVYTSLSVRRVLNRVRRQAEAYERAIQTRRG